MSKGLMYMHSHSGLEREINFSKSKVLVDEEWADKFTCKSPMRVKGKRYIVVHIMDFVKKGGVFKNLSE